MPCLQATRSTRYTLTFSIIIIVGYVIKVYTLQASCPNESRNDALPHNWRWCR